MQAPLSSSWLLRIFMGVTFAGSVWFITSHYRYKNPNLQCTISLSEIPVLPARYRYHEANMEPSLDPFLKTLFQRTLAKEYIPSPLAVALLKDDGIAFSHPLGPKLETNSLEQERNDNCENSKTRQIRAPSHWSCLDFLPQH